MSVYVWLVASFILSLSYILLVSFFVFTIFFVFSFVKFNDERKIPQGKQWLARTCTSKCFRVKISFCRARGKKMNEREWKYKINSISTLNESLLTHTWWVLILNITVLILHLSKCWNFLFYFCFFLFKFETSCFNIKLCNSMWFPYWKIGNKKNSEYLQFKIIKTYSTCENSIYTSNFFFTKYVFHFWIVSNSSAKIWNEKKSSSTKFNRVYDRIK